MKSDTNDNEKKNYPGIPVIPGKKIYFDGKPQVKNLF